MSRFGYIIAAITDLIKALITPGPILQLHDVFKHPFLKQGNDKKENNTYLTPIETGKINHRF